MRCETKKKKSPNSHPYITMADQQTVPHVLLVSFPGQGHVNPLLRLAKRIASKGPLVTFSSSEDIGHKIATSTNSTPGATVPIGKGHLRLEFFSDGWAHDEPRRSNYDDLMVNVRTVWPIAVTDLIHRQAACGRPVSCVINNPFLPWVLDAVANMRIPCAVLWVQSCTVFSTYYHYHHALAEFPTSDCPDVSVSLPGIPTMKPDELPTFLLPTTPSVSVREAILEPFHNLHKATWVFANSFEELERDVIRELSVPMIPVGPLVDEPDETGLRGDLWKTADCMSWLDAQEPHSVVYVSLGSVVVVTREEMGEMAYGLRETGKPFLWVVREKCQELLPDGFVEEMEGKGMVVGWSPQEGVLSHDSVGCFVSHCGWNSTLEALAAGVPVVAYPQWGDQVTDAKFMVEAYGVGVRLSAPVSGEELVMCVREVMAGEEIRRRAGEWKEAARGAISEGGSSERNIESFVEEVRRRARDCGEDEGSGPEASDCC